MHSITSQQSIQPFNFEDHQVRIVTIEGEPWFILSDVCKVLAMTNPSYVKSRLNSEDVSTLSSTEGGGDRNIVNESGLYDVILDSRKPQAKAFRRWITSEVIPSINKHGGYLTEQKIEEVLTDPDTLIRLATNLKEERAKREALESQNQQQAEQIEQAAPKVDYHDTYVADEDLLSFRTVASTLDMKESDLRELLIDKGWIYRESGTRWSPTHQKKQNVTRYSEYAAKKPLFRRVQHHDVPRFQGEVMHTLKITPTGAVAIKRLVSRNMEVEAA